MLLMPPHVSRPGVAGVLGRTDGALQLHVVPFSHLQLLGGSQVAAVALPGHRQLAHIYERSHGRALMKRDISFAVELRGRDRTYVRGGVFVPVNTRRLTVYLTL